MCGSDVNMERDGETDVMTNRWRGREGVWKYRYTGIGEEKNGDIYR